MIVDPSAHPQHMNGLKHLVGVHGRCGNNSMWVWGLNQSTLTHLQPCCGPRNFLTPETLRQQV